MTFLLSEQRRTPTVRQLGRFADSICTTAQVEHPWRHSRGTAKLATGKISAYKSVDILPGVYVTGALHTGPWSASTLGRKSIELRDFVEFDFTINTTIPTERVAEFEEWLTKLAQTSGLSRVISVDHCSVELTLRGNPLR